MTDAALLLERSRNARVVLTALWEHADARAQTWCSPTLNELAGDTGLKRDKVHEAVWRLQGAGLLSIRKAPTTEPGEYARNVYVLHAAALEQATTRKRPDMFQPGRFPNVSSRRRSNGEPLSAPREEVRAG